MNFNKILTRVIVGSFVFSVFTTLPAYAAITGTVNDAGVNIRKDSSTKADVLGKAKDGQSVNVVASKGDFYQIDYNGQNAFIAKDFVDLKKTEGYVNDDSVNVRKKPSTTGEIVGTANAGAAYTLLGMDGDWYAVDIKNEIAYIHKDFMKAGKPEVVKADKAAVTPVVTQNPLPVLPVESTPADIAALESQQAANKSSVMATPAEPLYAVVNAETGLKLRSAPSTEDDVLMFLEFDEEIDVIESDEYWVHTNVDGLDGYVSAEHVTLQKGAKPVAEPMSSPVEQMASDEMQAQADEVIAYAKQFLGTPYVYGGTDLNSGVDCSGFVYSVFKEFGVSLNRSSRDMAHNGYPVLKDELLPGDLVFFSANGTDISHVGIYIGDGQYIHSTDSKNNIGVVISNLNSDYSANTYHGATRILE